jgi:hypothetical protein
MLSIVPEVPLVASGNDWTLPPAAGLTTPSSPSPSLTFGATTGRAAAWVTEGIDGVFEEMAMLIIDCFLVDY